MEWLYDAATHRADDSACVVVADTGARVRKLVLAAGADADPAGGRCARCAETVRFAYRVVQPADGRVLETQCAASWCVAEPSLAPDLAAALRTMACGERAVFWAPLASVWDQETAATTATAATAETTTTVAVEVWVRDVEHSADCARVQRQQNVPCAELAAAVAHGHARGNTLFRAGNFAAALRRYTAAAELARVLASRDGGEEDNGSRLAVLLTNAAACAARLESWAAAEQYARDALAVDPHNAKAHHRLCTALAESGHVREAAAAARTATAQCPASRELRTLCERLCAQCRDADRTSAMYGVFRTPAQQ